MSEKLYESRPKEKTWRKKDPSLLPKCEVDYLIGDSDDSFFLAISERIPHPVSGINDLTSATLDALYEKSGDSASCFLRRVNQLFQFIQIQFPQFVFRVIAIAIFA